MTRVLALRAWARANLYPNHISAVVSALAGFALLWLVWQVLDWGVFKASWTGSGREACLKPEQGACWAFVQAKFGQFIYGRYPEELRWRVNVVFALMALGTVLLLAPFERHRAIRALIALGAIPPVILWLLVGGLGLAHVDSLLWGGLLLTLVVALSGIAASLPLGILLALGRQSHLVIIRWLCISFIELIRGVPLITLLFMASIMLPLFFPPGWAFNKLLNCLIGVALFASAYMAEIIRGGLQSLARGQYEAAQSLGLSYWRMQQQIVLPQVLTRVLPGIVNTFIGLFKDTSLVLIIGLFDLLGIVQLHFTDASWSTPDTRLSGYAFAGAVFWVFCYAMSRYSRYIERQQEYR